MNVLQSLEWPEQGFCPCGRLAGPMTGPRSEDAAALSEFFGYRHGFVISGCKGRCQVD
jgi:hypothetical protein